MRAYFFCNTYLSSLQCGLQSAHCLAEMFIGYLGSKKEQQLHEWAVNHKTMILLNGGFARDLNELHECLKATDFPSGIFKEEEAALNNATTCVGVILPERIYEGAKKIRESTDPARALHTMLKVGIVHEGETWSYTNKELELMERLNKYSLAH